MRKRTNRDIQLKEAGGNQTSEATMSQQQTLMLKEEEASPHYSSDAISVPPEQLTYLSKMIAVTTDAIFAIDSDYNVCGFNPAASSIFQWSYVRESISRCSEILKCRNMNGTLLCGTSRCPLVRVLQKTEPLTYEELLLGGEMPHEMMVSAVKVEIDKKTQVVFTARDKSAVNQVNQVRANFVSMVSHELRTPLNSVHGFIDLLMHGHMGSLNEEQQRYLGYAQEGVQQLIAIVEDILFMTRSDSGQFEMYPEPVNIQILAKQVVGSLELQTQKAEVTLQKDIPIPSPWMMVDPQRMKQVLTNLVTNAIKYTPPGGTITIRVRQEKQSEVVISVIDTGTGIAPKDQPHVFERFYQSNTPTQSKMGGYGLGLPIARLIVEQHHGKIGFKTEVNQGTTFYFTAPAYNGKKKDKASSLI